MLFSSGGEALFGTGAMSQNIGDVNNPSSHRDKINWDNHPDTWRESTIQALAFHRGKVSVGMEKQSEIAFYALTQYPSDVHRDDCCKIGTVCASKVLMVGDYEYRTRHNKIYRRLI
jgi:hypothetical protein